MVMKRGGHVHISDQNHKILLLKYIWCTYGDYSTDYNYDNYTVSVQPNPKMKIKWPSVLKTLP